jgi:serine/threonine-protein kinase HipA
VRRARVSLAGRPVGVLEESGPGTVFQYSAEWLATKGAVPISLTLPLRAEPFLSDGLHPFFANLLPEGWLLELTLSKLKLSKEDPFGILLATCADCVGAVEVTPWEGGEAP